MPDRFKTIPFEYYIQSPVGLVPKDSGKDTRLIFHLSYPRMGKFSVNANTPDELCSVKYTEFDQAIKLCIQADNNEGPIYLSKSDAQSAFRVLGLNPESWQWTVLKAQSPIDGLWYYFVDKCLPFGSSISCALFQKVSDAIAHLVYFRTKVFLINYLDDFLFVSSLKWGCNKQLEIFLAVSKDVRMPISQTKTFYATPCLTFLGFLIDGNLRMVLIPVDKITKANDEHLQQNKRKTTVLKLQQLCGFLNFLCRCVCPGRAFTRCLYTGINPKLKPHHHVKITGEMRMDLRMWRQFLSHQTAFCRPFTDFDEISDAQTLDFFTDASRNFRLGGGDCCENQWFFVGWDPLFMERAQPSIAYLKLYAVTVGVYLWLKKIPKSNNSFVL